MSNLSITYSFVNNTTADASQVNTNYSDISTWLNNRDNGTDYWLNMKVLATVANPADISSSASSTELSLNNSAADGDPILTFKLSGSQTHVIGVDDSDSDFLKFATTGITTNVAMQIPTVGAQVQLSNGTVLLPGAAFIGKTNAGLYLTSSSPAISANGVFATRWGESGGVTQTLAASGTVGLPAYSFASATTGGLWNNGGTIAISSGGVLGASFVESGSRVSVVLGAGSIATDADSGFLYVVSCAGTPTGTPAAQSGRNATVYDTTANKIWVYNGSWRGVSVS